MKTAPPLEWFRSPRLDRPTPLTVTDDGRVFGHAAVFGVCHVGLPDRCVMVPSSKNLYRPFHRRRVEVAGGVRVTCGTITVDTDHPALTASAAETVLQLGLAGTAAAEVRAGEDEFGVWVNGRVLQANAKQLHDAHLSGDWRTVDGSLELVGLLVVDVPGFPVPRARVALSASADAAQEVTALTAAAFVPSSVRPERGALRRPEPKPNPRRK